MSQPRQPVGTRQGDVPVGGQYTHKTVPTVEPGDVDLGLDEPVVGPVKDWNQRSGKVWGLQTTFERVVETDVDGNDIVTVTTDCEPPDMLLLARKGDASYWSNDFRKKHPTDPWSKTQPWAQNHKDRRIWCSDITRRMLQEGLVSTTAGRYAVDGIRAAMHAAGSPKQLSKQATPHRLTETVAQIRGVRLIESMRGDIVEHPGFVVGGYDLPGDINDWLYARYVDVYRIYKSLSQPPWDTTNPAGVPWGPQTVAGNATNIAGVAVFVGEHSDLIWRALTETTLDGWTPLKAGIKKGVNPGIYQQLIVAAALYDETAERQLTTDLFVPGARRSLHASVLWAFKNALNPAVGECRWGSTHQDQIRGIITVLEDMDV